MKQVASLVAILALLLLAAFLEVGGDALMRTGLHATGTTRVVRLLAGTAALAAYGTFVNLGPWDFGRVLGTYVVLFFIVAQIVNWVGFGLAPSWPVLLGGSLIFSGGAVLVFFG